jgi:hypothetical protein
MSWTRVGTAAWFAACLTISIASCSGGGPAAPAAGRSTEETSNLRTAPDTQHAVLIHIAAPDNPDTFGLDLIEDPLYEALDGSSVGELDGNEIGPDGAVIYLYGPDADRLFSTIEPALKSAPVSAGSYAIKRYGGPGARETRVPLH